MPEIRSLVKSGQINIASLRSILKIGELGMVESRSRKGFKQVTVFGLVNAPPERIFDVIQDYDNYIHFMPKIVSMKSKWEGNKAKVEVELEVPGSNIKYSFEADHQRPTSISSHPIGGDISAGRWLWELMPIDGRKRTIILRSLITDVGETSWILRQVIKSDPEIANAINLATGIVEVKSIKKRAEGVK